MSMRMSPAERREEILGATHAVMARKGIAGTTVRDVAGELGISSGLIHHYFTSMDSLLAEVFERASLEDLAATSAAVASQAAPIERLRAFLHSFGRVEGDASMQLWLDAWAEASRRPEIQSTSQRVNEEWHRLLRGIIEDGRAAGVMDSPDPEVSAWRLLALLDGLTLQSVAHAARVTRVQIVQWSCRAAELELALPPGALDS